MRSSSRFLLAFLRALPLVFVCSASAADESAAEGAISSGSCVLIVRVEDYLDDLFLADGSGEFLSSTLAGELAERGLSPQRSLHRSLRKSVRQALDSGCDWIVDPKIEVLTPTTRKKQKVSIALDLIEASSSSTVAKCRTAQTRKAADEDARATFFSEVVADCLDTLFAGRSSAAKPDAEPAGSVVPDAVSSTATPKKVLLVPLDEPWWSTRFLDAQTDTSLFEAMRAQLAASDAEVEIIREDLGPAAEIARRARSLKAATAVAVTIGKRAHGLGAPSEPARINLIAAMIDAATDRTLRVAAVSMPLEKWPPAAEAIRLMSEAASAALLNEKKSSGGGIRTQFFKPPVQVRGERLDDSKRLARMQIEGPLEVRFTITPSGRTAGIEIIGADRNAVDPDINDAIEAVVRGWHFMPARLDDQAIPFDMIVRMPHDSESRSP